MRKLKIKLSTKPEKAIGDDATWKIAIQALKKALDSINVEYEIKEGEGAFYGPKIDIDIADALGRDWQCSTIQLDFFMPQRFELEYIDEKSKKQRPVMIHVAMLGTLERFLAILIEHYAGAFPTWLAPVQVKLISFTDKNVRYAKKVEESLCSSNIRVEVDYSSNTIQKKVREAEMKKIPYILCIGNKEEEANTIAVRIRGKKKLEFGVKLTDFIKKVKKEIDERKISP